MVKCPVCGKDINELDESCPYCHIVFDDMIEEVEEVHKETKMYEEENNNKKTKENAVYLNLGQEQSQGNKNNGNGCAIILFIVFLIIFVPILIGLISNNIKSSNKLKLEQQLIQEGKVKSDNEVINEIVDILKNRDENKLKGYLSKNITYYDNNNMEYKYLSSSFWSNLKYLIKDEYDIEKRENDIKDQETYRIYWNVVEQNKSLGRTNQYYCLQTITIVLNRIVKKDIITYEIEKIILKNN